MVPVHIGDRAVGPDEPTYIIAEVGSNHAGRLERARELVVAAAEAGADAVKFQSWVPGALQNYRDLDESGGLVESSVLPVLEKYTLRREWHSELLELCASLGVDFLSTPFDVDSSRFVVSLGVPAVKVSSSDVVYEELLIEVGSSGLPVLIATGMATLGEIERAIQLIGHREIALLHCVAMYPPVFEEANLSAIQTLSSAFGLPVGFSDHFPGHEVDVAAVALGACVIEKHITVSRTDGAPDSSYALEVAEFASMTREIRQLESALGDGRKRCMPCEEGGLTNGRRSIFAARDLKPGDVISREDVAVVRPNIGEMKPRHLDLVVGRTVGVPVEGGRALRWSDLQR